MRQPKWTAEAIQDLGVQTDVPTAGSIFGWGKDASYRAIKRGEFPVPVLQLGRRLVVPVQPILDLLGLGTPAGGAPPEAPPAIASTPPQNGSTGDYKPG